MIPAYFNLRVSNHDLYKRKVFIYIVALDICDIMVDNISQEVDTSDLIDSKYFWPIYLACLEKPRNLWEISDAYGLMKTSIRKKSAISAEKGYEIQEPTAHVYNQRALIKQMVGRGFLKSSFEGKAMKYLAVLDKITGDVNYTKLFSQDWARSNLFGIEEIKNFFKFETNGVKEIQKNGGMFLEFVSQLVAFHAITTKLELKGNQQPIIQMIENACPGIPFYTSIDAFNYKINMRKVLDAHKSEIHKTLKPSIENKDALPS